MADHNNFTNLGENYLANCTGLNFTIKNENLPCKFSKFSSKPLRVASATNDLGLPLLLLGAGGKLQEKGQHPG